MSSRLKELFNYHKKEEFPVELAEWIGQVFYDILPEHGYEVREEQIFTAFQLADAVCNKKVHLAEAGLGTGKTFAYLLTAIAYARFSGKPVVIACASTALQEQLAGLNGDIQTLSHILGLEIDARMAKDPRQYICDARVNEFSSLFAEKSNTMSDEINQWLRKTNRGERSEMPLVSDSVWKQIGWDESMSCDLCSSRGFCKLVKAREHYRHTRDLIIADHEIFFDDLWTRDERIADGKLPILPSYSAVIFDEGHKVILPAAMRAGRQIIKEDIDNIISALEEIQGARESLISIGLALEEACSDFFIKLSHCVIADKRSDRLALRVEGTLLKAADTFHKALDRLLLEIQIEQELYLESLPISLLQTYETQIERAMMALDRFGTNKSRDVITWVDQLDGSFWVVPRNLSKMLDIHLFQKRLPVVFTSATLSNEGDFSYFTRTLGLKKPSCSTVGSAFDIEKQVVVYLPECWSNNYEDVRFSLGIKKLVSLLKLNGGRALVLTNSLDEVRKIRRGLEDYQLPFEVLWEDRGERGYLVRKFREEVSSVLIGSSFWEGIDVPGEALSLLIVWQLPFPSLDPLIEVQRKEAKEEGFDPMMTVDYPEMGLILKQGCGRLIRTKDDRGTIVIMESVIGAPWEKVVMGALPPGARIRKIEDLL
ncbi:ATP-dependent DNA helicase [Lutibacter sp. B2]|nr:ATP-dependent DNA helicase [Lutibacter sp. B2]MBF8984030.1 ATP-dependent DNA helicase [Lutibacter sp. B2]